jgi:hypothetical protein
VRAARRDWEETRDAGRRARLAECSPDFLYRTPALRTAIERLRGQPRGTPPPQPIPDSNSAVVRTLASRLAEEKRRRREEGAALESALAAAQGELLELRRRLSAGDRPAARPEAAAPGSRAGSCE